MLARIDCSEPQARRIAALIGERLEETIVSAFESGRGWRVEIHPVRKAERGALHALVKAAAGAKIADTLRYARLPRRDWIKASLAGLPPVAAGRFVVHGAHSRGHIPRSAISIEIEASLAFGTGHHGTTRGCLLALDRLARRRRFRRIADLGTGSGVLAIAAARAFHRPVAALDIDPAALTVARANARLNRAGALVAFGRADARRALPWGGRFDLIFANILLGPIVGMAAPVALRLAKGGRIVLSGLLPEQANAALAAWRAQGLTLERGMIVDGWATIVMRRGTK